MPPRLPTVPAPVAALVAGCLGLALGRMSAPPVPRPPAGAPAAAVLAPVGLQAYVGRLGGERGAATPSTEARWRAGLAGPELGPWFVPRWPTAAVVVARDRAGLAVVVPAPRAAVDPSTLAASGELL